MSIKANTSMRYLGSYVERVSVRFNQVCFDVNPAVVNNRLPYAGGLYLG